MAFYVSNPHSRALWCEAAKQQVPPRSYIAVSQAVHDTVAAGTGVLVALTTPPATGNLAPTRTNDGTVNDVGRFGPGDVWTSFNPGAARLNQPADT